MAFLFFLAVFCIDIPNGHCDFVSFVRELLEPKLIGKRLGVYPIAVLMAIYVGIRLFGIGGIVLGPISVLIIYEWMNALTKQAK